MNLIRFADSDGDIVWVNPMKVTHLEDHVAQARDGAPLTTIYISENIWIDVKGDSETIANRLRGGFTMETEK